MHLNSVGSPELASIVEYLVSIAPSEVSMSTETGSNRRTHRGLAFLADFRACSQSIFRIVIDALDSVQSRSPGSVAVFYALLPRSKELAKSLQKMLGLYQKKTLLPSRKSAPDPNAKSFQSVLLPSSQELYQFVSKANLMPDFGGTLNYDHQAWMKLRTQFDTLLAEVADIADRAPAALDSLARLKDNQSENGGEAGEASLQESAHGMQDQFQRVTASLGLEATSERVAQLLAACKEPANHPETRALAGNSLLRPYIERLERLQARLDELRQLLQDKWKQAETGLLVDGRLGDYRRSVLELGDWLDRWSKEVAKRVDTRSIANQQMAEDAREKMRIQVLEPSASKLAECRTLTGRLRRLLAALPPSGVGGEPHEAAQLADELEAKLKNFNERIKLASEQLIRICAFFGGCA
uniref:CRAL-TRIO domain-containing protein n=1 Tax=Macrostomum lignano TaxID=282301 RepID=A0A1I8JEQ4_9PLAT